jgi:ribosomal protein S18 acetylase RimI-like enzyme
MEIIRATEFNITDVSRLFNLYRQFYGCEDDIYLASNYIAERIHKHESVIFIAHDGKSAKGFVQLYPSFCSVEAIKIYILYDLYVEQDSRKNGIGNLLMNRASEFAKDSGALRVDLQTAHDNSSGQHLYEKLDYQKVDEEYYSYSLHL